MDNPFRFAAEDPELAKHRITQEHETRRQAHAEVQKTKRVAIEKREPWVRLWLAFAVFTAVVGATIGSISYFSERAPAKPPEGCRETSWRLAEYSKSSCEPHQTASVKKTDVGDVLFCACGPQLAPEPKP